VTRACLGELLTALVDGALSHAERERALAHLTGCAGCREEVEAQRALKARLAAIAGTPAPPDSLVRSLRALAVPGTDPLARPFGPPQGAPVRPRGARPGGAAPPAAGPGRGPLGRLRRTSTVGGGLVALGVSAALLLGGAGGAPASTPVDPGSVDFVVDFVSTTSEVPLADPVGLTLSPPR